MTALKSGRPGGPAGRRIVDHSHHALVVRAEGAGSARAGGYPPSGSREDLSRLSPSTLRRPEAAYRHRHGADPGARPVDRRRTDHGAGCDHAGSDPFPDQRAAGVPRHGRNVHHPRFRRRGGHRRQGCGHAGRSDRRDRDGGRRPWRPPACLYQNADRVRTLDHPTGPRGSHRAGRLDDAETEQNASDAAASLSATGSCRRQRTSTCTFGAGKRWGSSASSRGRGNRQLPAASCVWIDPTSGEIEIVRYRHRGTLGGETAPAPPRFPNDLPGSFPVAQPPAGPSDNPLSRGRSISESAGPRPSSARSA